MFGRSACIGLTAIVLAGCSQSLREWWTEDLRDSRAVHWRERPSPNARVAGLPAQGDPFEQDENNVRSGQDLIPSRDATRRAPPPLTSPPASALRHPLPLTSPTTSSPPPRRSPRQTETPPPPPAAARLAATPPAPSSDAPPMTAPVPERRSIVPPVVSVAGMSEPEVRRALGGPLEEIDKGSQKIWTYKGDGCSVEVIFFLDVTRDAYAALDHRTFASDGTLSAQPCLRSVAARESSPY